MNDSRLAHIASTIKMSKEEVVNGGIALARELRAVKQCRVEEARARLRGLRQLKAQLDPQIQDAQVALDNAERDAKE